MVTKSKSKKNSAFSTWVKLRDPNRLDANFDPILDRQ
jgi:hypothetical protein